MRNPRPRILWKPNLPALTAAMTLVGGCSGGDRPGSDSWQAERDTVGDTIIVRTTAGSTWGAPRRLVPELRIGEVSGADEYLFGQLSALALDSAGRIYAFDSQLPALRVYDTDGRFLRTIGGEGAGPGEYRQPDPNGLAVLPDGRILLHDPGNARVNVYSPDGESLESWPMRGSAWTDYPLFTDTAGHVFAYVWNRGPGGGNGLLKLSPEGEPLDTLALPKWDYQAPTISARSGGSSQTWSVPFSPGSRWTWSPRGYFIGGLSTRYAIDIFRPDSAVLRIERLTEPVAITAGEKAAQEHRARTAMQRMDPSWRWNGPPIVGTKPPFRGIHTDRDGRIWVRLHAPGREVATGTDAGDAPPGQPSAPPEWTEPILFDVFDPDGRYLGQVEAPEDFRTSPLPVLGTERVWAVAEDELGVQSIVRYRIQDAGAAR